MTVKSIEQLYLNVKGSEKRQALLNIIYKHQPNSALIFANTKKYITLYICFKTIKSYSLSTREVIGRVKK